MKKNLLFIPLLGMILACSEGKIESTQSSDVVQEQTELINKSIQKLDETIQSTEDEIKTKQSEIDSLLNDI
jgi:peptidoglycan hydrolase CwlO-like protein